MGLYFSSASTGRTDKEQALLRQVLVDVPRTSPGIPLFQAEFVQRVSARASHLNSRGHKATQGGGALCGRCVYFVVCGLCGCGVCVG